MRTVRNIAIWVSFLLLAGGVHCEPANSETIKEYLDLIGAAPLMQEIQKENSDNIDALASDAYAAYRPNPEQRLILDRTFASIRKQMQQFFSSDNLQAIYIRALKEVFTQEELEAANAFFKTPIGRSYAAKEAQLEKQLKPMIQTELAPVRQRMREEVRQAVKEIKAASHD